MQSVPLGAQSGCSGSQSSAAAPTPRGTSHDAHAAAADAAAGSAATSHHISHTHSFIHRSFVGSFIHVHIHACTHLFICLFICSLIYLFTHLFVRSFTHSYTHPLIPSCMHSCIQSFIISSFCSFIHALFVLSIIHLLGQVINLQHLQTFGQLQGWCYYFISADACCSTASPLAAARDNRVLVRPAAACTDVSVEIKSISNLHRCSKRCTLNLFNASVQGKGGVGNFAYSILDIGA